jgi:hypothetical protein
MIYIRPRVKPPALIDNLGLGIIFYIYFVYCSKTITVDKFFGS